MIYQGPLSKAKLLNKQCNAKGLQYFQLTENSPKTFQVSWIFKYHEYHEESSNWSHTTSQVF